MPSRNQANSRESKRESNRSQNALFIVLVLLGGGTFVMRLRENWQKVGLDRKPEFRLDLNRADEAELKLLPGVGEHTAEKIAAKRTEVGRFSSIDDLQKVDGIGEKRTDQLRDSVQIRK